MSTPFIPAADDQFDGFFAALNAYVQDNTSALGLDTQTINALAAAFADWQTKWTAWQQVQNTYNSLLAAKNASRDTATIIIRQINNQV